jgi:hypothetical protein
MQLPLEYGLHLLASLKKGHAGTFTLRPSLGLTGPFIIEGPGRGGRFRVRGMRAFLEGATTKSPDTMISITISTSGIYSDILDAKTFDFTSRPLSRRFDYMPGYGKDDHKVGTDSYVEAVSYIVVTPFTEWTITLNNPEEIDLSNLTSVELKWEGTTVAYTG